MKVIIQRTEGSEAKEEEEGKRRRKTLRGRNGKRGTRDAFCSMEADNGPTRLNCIV